MAVPPTGGRMTPTDRDEWLLATRLSDIALANVKVERDHYKAALEEIENEGCGEPEFEDGCQSVRIARDALYDGTVI